MKRLLTLLLPVLTCMAAVAQRVTLSLQDETLASALRQIDHAQQERRIIFVLNDLDSIRVTRDIFRRTALEAVNEVCEGHPILVTECEADILVEYIRPPIRLLPNALVTRRQLQYDAEGYVARLNRQGMTGRQLLLLLPHLTATDDGRLCLNGQEVQAYYLNGQRLTDAEELLALPSDMIEEVRVNERTSAIYVTLRKPTDGGYYGSLTAEADRYQSSVESGLGGLWVSRYGKTSLYDRLDAESDDVTHSIHQSGMTTGNRLHTLQQTFSNRLSLSRELTSRSTLGLSYYIASHQGQAKARRDDGSGFIDFNGHNRHIDQELTLRYTSTFGARGARFEALADYYSRQTTSTHISLYGAGVGTEMGEAPSISMWRLASEWHLPISPHLTMHVSKDCRYFHSYYDPQMYLSNFTGSPAFLYAMKQRGLMLKVHAGTSMQWQRLQVEAGAALQWHIALQTIRGEAKGLEPTHGYDYSDAGVSPYLQLHCPLDEGRRHQLTLAWQRDLEDIPYAAMSPAVRWSDAFNYSTGNRKLRSPEVERWMLGVTGWEGQASVTASYLRLHREIFWQSAISSGQTDVCYTQPVNLPATRLWLLQAEANLHPLRGWQMKLDALWQWRPEDNTIGGTRYDALHLRQEYAWHNVIDCGRGFTVSLHAAYLPTFHVFDRTYHSRHSLRGELQRGFLADHLRCALTFRVWQSDRRLDRQIGTALVSHRDGTAPSHLGLRATWKFDGGRRVKVPAVEGAQQYNDIKDY